MVKQPSSDELREFRAEVAAWFENERPKEPDFLLPETFMEVGTDAQFHFLRDWQNKVYDAGYLGMSWPAEYGGGGKHPAFQKVADQEMARLGVPFMLNTIGLNWAGPLILHMGTEEEKTRYIRGILSAEDIWCQGFSEPDHGSDLGSAQTRAVRDGDEWVFNGSKIWTSLGTYAKYMILLARTNPDAPNRYAGLSYFLTPMKVDGIETVPIRKLTGEYGFVQTFFRDARVPASCLMGEEGQGWQIAMLTLQFERGAQGGQAGGLSSMYISAEDVLELARRSKRDGKPVLEDPLIRDQMVRFLIEAKGDRLCDARSSIPVWFPSAPIRFHFPASCGSPNTGAGCSSLRSRCKEPTVRALLVMRSRRTKAGGSARTSTRSPPRSAAGPRRCRPTSSASACSDFRRADRERNWQE